MGWWSLISGVFWCLKRINRLYGRLICIQDLAFFTANDEGGIVIPLGVGVKFNLYGNLSCGVEWGGRKLFTDKIDGLEDAWETGETNFFFNKDWFFVSGVTLTYRFPMNMECRGYK